MQLKYDLSAPVIFHALISAGGHVALAEKYLEYSREDLYIPWTWQEDKALSGNDERAITNLKRKRGIEECTKRCEFLNSKK